jgi:glycosyltransferase involved in cell wall biosynthesis
VRISIITATWNCADTVVDCLESVAGQTYAEREHIVIDGASTDGTVEMLRSHRAGLAALVSEPDRGIYEALNKGIARATGDVIGFLHADDVYADARVLARVAERFADPGVQAVYGDLVYLRRGEGERVLRRWRSGAYRPARLARGWMPPHPTLYLRRALYERHGTFDVSYRIAADYDFVLRVFSRLQEAEVGYIPETLVHMRTGGASNRSLANLVRKSAEDWRALRHNRIGGIGALAWKNLSKLTQFL